MEEKKVKPEGEKTVKPVEKTLQSVPRWTWHVLIGLCSFLIFVVIIIGIVKIAKNHKQKEVAKALTEEVARDKTKTVKAPPPDEYHLLKKGNEPIRVYMKDGYKCNYYGGGKEYYHQAQNSEREIWGGKGKKCPTGLGSPYATYADISAYREDSVTVTCKFVPK